MCWKEGTTLGHDPTVAGAAIKRCCSERQLPTLQSFIEEVHALNTWLSLCSEINFFPPNGRLLGIVSTINKGAIVWQEVFDDHAKVRSMKTAFDSDMRDLTSWKEGTLIKLLPT